MVQPAPPARARAAAVPARQRAAPGAASAAAPVTGAAVCGAAIEPVISAVAMFEAFGNLGDLRVRRFVGLLEARLQRGDFLAELGDRLLHRFVLFDGGDVGLGRRRCGNPPLARAPITAPSAAANVTDAASKA